MSGEGSGGNMLPNKRRKFFPQQLIEQPSAAAMLLAGRASDMPRAAPFGPQPVQNFYPGIPSMITPIGPAGGQMLRPMMRAQFFPMGPPPGQFMGGPQPPPMQTFMGQQPMAAPQQQFQRGGHGYGWGASPRGGPSGRQSHPLGRAPNGHIPPPLQQVPAQPQQQIFAQHQQQVPAQPQQQVSAQPQPDVQQQQQQQQQLQHQAPEQAPRVPAKAGPPTTMAVVQAGCARAAPAQPRRSADAAPVLAAPSSPADADPARVAALKTAQALPNGTIGSTAPEPALGAQPAAPVMALPEPLAQAPAGGGQAQDTAAKAAAPDPASVKLPLQPSAQNLQPQPTAQKGPQGEQGRPTEDSAASAATAAECAPANASDAAQAAEAFLSTMWPLAAPGSQHGGDAADGTPAGAGELMDTDGALIVPEAEEEPERERTLADVLVWRRGEWRGPSPREHLLDWSLRNGLPRPCYELLRSNQAAASFFATCILPHAGIQVTPAAAFPTPEDAEQNAALFAIVHAEGGFSDNTPSSFCTVSEVGKSALPGWTPVPALVPDQAALQRLLDERMDRLTVQMGALQREYLMRKAVLEQELQALAEQAATLASGGARAQAVVEALQGVSAGEDAGAGGSGAAAAAKRAKLVVQPQAKGSVQELKERCEKARWLPPTYDFLPSMDGKGFLCRLSIVDAGIQGVQSRPYPNQKAAKAEAAARGLAALRAKHG